MIEEKTGVLFANLNGEKVANDWESEIRDSDEGKTWGKVPGKSLFTVFQSWRVLDEMRDKLKFLCVVFYDGSTIMISSDRSTV